MPDSKNPEDILTMLYVIYSIVAALYYYFIISFCFRITNREKPAKSLIVFLIIQGCFILGSVLLMEHHRVIPFLSQIVTIRRLDLYSRILITLIYISTFFFTGNLKSVCSRKSLIITLSVFTVIESAKFIHHDLFPNWYTGEIRPLTNSLAYLLPSIIVLSGFQPFLKSYFKDGEHSIILNPDISALLGKQKISEKERQVIEGICLGKSNKEIAYDLSVSLSSVKFHSHNIYKKLNISNRVELNNLIKN